VASAAQDAALKLLRSEHPGYQVVNPEVFKKTQNTEMETI
jgi:hypothetical protein